MCNAKNMNWQSIYDSLTTDKTRDLFDTDLLVQNNGNDQIDTPLVNINVNKIYMTRLLLLDDTGVLSLFDTGLTVNLISDSVIKYNGWLYCIYT